MCGRFTITTPLSELKEAFDVEVVAPELEQQPPQRFNVAPSQEVLSVRVVEERRRLDLLRWGLVPFWAKDTKIGYKLINARSETAQKLPAFRGAFPRHRCLVLADGFYEWLREGKKKLGHHIRRRDGRPFAMAGLWERWRGPARDAEVPLESCTVLTVEANGLVSRIHDRMPAILRPEDVGPWLDRGTPVDEAQALLRPFAEDELVMVPVGPWVNDARHEGKECLAPPVEAPARGPEPPGQTTLFGG
jgi:putative SOS response-associated peptidase YedK